MGEMIADGAEFSCTLCDSKIKMIVPSCSTTGDGKKIANKSNHILLPAPMCKICPQAPPPCVPSVTITDPGQSPNDIDNVKGLGKGCKGICARGGSLSLSDPAQKIFQHDGAGAAASVAGITGALIDAASSGGGEDENKDDKKKKEEEKKKTEKKVAKEKRKDYMVYRSVDPKTGKTQYVGITNNIDRRAAQHLKKKGIRIKPIPGMKNLSKTQARGVEQALIEHHGLGKSGGALLNKINSISTKNPKYGAALRGGKELLKQNKYSGFK
ncbi:MAG: hypothetical protein ChlgKO_01400 [Chlamydiales bacterium]